MLARSVSEIDELPADACPQDQAILSLTLHPEYVAKSYFPKTLLDEIGVTVSGSRPKKLIPEKLSSNHEPYEIVTTELFALASRSAIRNWSEGFPNWNNSNRCAKDLIAIEEIATPKPLEKIKSGFSDAGMHSLEVVLYASEIQARNRILKEFQKFLEVRSIPNEIGRRFFAKGLCFLEIEPRWKQLNKSLLSQL